MINPWLATALALVPPLLFTTIAAARTTVRYRLVAVEMATSLTIIMLVVLSFAFDQASSIDLALTVALLTLPGTLLLALFEERWL